jgi:ubiquitin carboxyl-terminal hydrolase L5
METDIQQTEISRLRLLIEEEELKNKQYQMENIRRKHNYLPLIVEILKILAKEGQLLPLYEKAKERAVEKEAKREEVKA